MSSDTSNECGELDCKPFWDEKAENLLLENTRQCCCTMPMCNKLENLQIIDIGAWKKDIYLHDFSEVLILVIREIISSRSLKN